jgi:hypothetical protein
MTPPDAVITDEPRRRIDAYLNDSGLATRSPRVVPLTGDASDRRYFRILLQDASSIVLSLYTTTFDFESLSASMLRYTVRRLP